MKIGGLAFACALLGCVFCESSFETADYAPSEDASHPPKALILVRRDSHPPQTSSVPFLNHADGEYVAFSEFFLAFVVVSGVFHTLTVWVCISSPCGMLVLE